MPTRQHQLLQQYSTGKKKGDLALLRRPVVLQKGRRRNAVQVALLLPRVHASTKDTKHPFHESGRGLDQGYVFGYIVPSRKFKPVVMSESPQIVSSIRLSRRNVVRIHLCYEGLDIGWFHEGAWRYASLLSRLSFCLIWVVLSRPTASRTIEHQAP